MIQHSYPPRIPRRLLGLLALGLLLGLATQPAAAQLRPQLDIGFITGIPQGEFAQQVEGPGLGLNLQVSLANDLSPFAVGVEGAFLIYGWERRREPFSLTIPDVTVDVNTTNNIAMGHAFFRIQPPVGSIRPYFDGLIGFKYFFTQTSIDGDDFDDYDGDLASSVNFDDIALSYGVGGGVDLLLGNPRFDNGRRGQVFLNLGVRYLFGDEADYLRKGSVQRDLGRVRYDIFRSETALLVPQLGVKIRM